MNVTKNKFLLAFVSSAVLSLSVFAVEAPIPVWDNETLCNGLAKETGNAFLRSGTHLNATKYCRHELKAKMVFPASSCGLEFMVTQCVKEISKTQ